MNLKDFLILEATQNRVLLHYTNAYSLLKILEDGFLKLAKPYKFEKDKETRRLYTTRPSLVSALPKLPVGLTGGSGPVRFIFDAQKISNHLRNIKIKLGRREEILSSKKINKISLDKKYLEIELLPEFVKKISGYIPVKMKLETYIDKMSKIYPKWKHLFINNIEKKKLEEKIRKI